jgi:hypothetical protein
VAPDDVEIRTVMESAAPCLNVRDRPSYRARIVGCVDSGRSVTVTGVNGGWSYIIVDDEVRGWAGSRFLEGGAEPPAAPDPGAASEPAAPEPVTPEPVTVDTPEPMATPPAPAEVTAPAMAKPESRNAEAGPATVSLEELLRVTSDRDRLREQLAAAIARIDQLEAETRALGERAVDSDQHLAGLEAVRGERDDLARQLAHAEAQQLYLQADLERTRSELMVLKGIPPKLVRIESPPAPEPLPLPADPEPEPEVEVEEAAEQPAIDLPEVVSVVSMDEVVATVRAWAKAWSDQRADDYLSFYSAAFAPSDGSSREFWAAQRRARIAAPRSIEVTLDRISPMVVGDRATVGFVQSYASDSFDDVVDKTLVLERTDGVWRIVEERTE